MKVIADKQYPTMFRIQWPDGRLSADFYNLTRAKEWLRIKKIKELEDNQIYRLFAGT